MKKEVVKALADAMVKAAELLNEEVAVDETEVCSNNECSLEDNEPIKVIRPVEMNVTRIELDDKINIQILNESYTATAIKQGRDSMLFCLDTCLSESFCMNKNGTNEGGYDESDLRAFLEDVGKGLSPDIKNRMVPFKNGDLLRIATREEMFGRDEYTGDVYEDLGGDQIPYFADSKNRVASRNGKPEWQWLQNKAVAVSAGFADCDSVGRSNHDYASDSCGVRPYFLIG